MKLQTTETAAWPRQAWLCKKVEFEWPEYKAAVYETKPAEGSDAA
jgi:hypothetical protein